MAISLEEWDKMKKSGAISAAPTATNPTQNVQPTATEQKQNITLEEWDRMKKSGTVNTNALNSYSTGGDINAWVNSASSLLDRYGGLVNGGWRDKNDKVYDQYYEDKSKLLAQAQGFRNQYAGNSEALSAIDDIVKQVSGASTWNPIKYYGQWDSNDDYLATLKEIERRNKYGGKSYAELQNILSAMDSSSEDYDWIKNYSLSDEVMTGADYDKLISRKEREISWLKNNNAVIGYGTGNAGGSMGGVGAERRYNTDIADAERELEELRSGKWRVENKKKYEAVPEAADFGTVSGTIDESVANGFGISFGSKSIGTADPVYAYINDIGHARAYNRGAGGNAALDKYGYMTDEQVGIYNYLYNTEGKKSAEEYLDYISYDLNAQSTADYVKNIENFAGKNALTAGVASVASVLTNLTSGTGLIDIAAQNLNRKLTGEYKPIDYNRMSMRGTYATTTIRGTVSNKIADATGRIDINEQEHPTLAKILNGKSLGDVYQLGMSMLDSYAVAYGFGVGGTALLGGAAGTQGIIDALDKGATDEQAVLMGIANGVFESLFETVSIERLLSGTVDNLVLDALKQGGVEASEEALTTLANQIADAVIMGKNSDWQKNVQYFIDHGMSPDEAKVHALMSAASDVFFDALGGFVTGGIMGGINHGASLNAQFSEDTGGYYENKDNVRELVSKALEIDPDNALAQKINGKLDDGRTPTMSQVRKTYGTVLENDKGKIRDAAAAQLRKYGETENVEELADALSRQAAGEKLKKADIELISSSRYGTRVANELNAGNIMSQEYTTGWAENIGTDVLNPLVYSKIAGLKRDIENSKPIAPITAESAAETISDDALTGNETVDAVIEKAVGKELSGNDVRPIIESKDAVTALERKVGSLYLQGKSPSEQRGIVRAAVQKYAAENKTVKNAQVSSNAKSSAALDKVAEKYGSQAEAVKHIYNMGPVENMEAFETAFDAPYRIGLDGGKESAAVEISATTVLTETQARLAYETGKSVRAAKMLETMKNIGRREGTVISHGVSIADLKKRFKSGSNQNSAYRVLSMIAKATGLTIELYDSSDVNYKKEQGSFDRGTDVVAIDIASGICSANDVEELAKYVMLRTFSHEFTHFGEKWAAEEYNILRAAVVDTLMARKEFDFDKRVKDVMEDQNLDWDGAVREVVAEAMTDVLPESRFMQRLLEKDPGLAGKIKNAFLKFLGRVRMYFAEIADNDSREAQALKVMDMDGTIRYMDGIVKMWDDMAVTAVENFNAETADAVADDVSMESGSVEDTTQFSVRSLAKAGGFIAEQDENGNIILSRDGKRVSEVTVDDIENSAIGALINHSFDSRYISKATADSQKKLFADLLTMAAKSNDFAMSMQFAGSAIFTALKSNSDKQYGTTYDFPSICTKTQAVIDSMSAAMKAKKGGLTKSEIEHIYNEVFHDGNPVPCPECYVFSRWVGIGSLLNNIWSYQNKFASMTKEEVQAQYLAMEEVINKVAEENNLTFGKAKGKLASKFTKRYNDLYEKITKAENQGEKVSDKDYSELAILRSNMELVKSMTWIDTVYFKDSSHTRANPKSRWFVDPNTLFDLNEGEAFAANHPEAWGFRTNQGAGYGKAITPYSEAVLGEGILGTNSINALQKSKKAGTLDNIFLNQKGTLDKNAKKKLDAATRKMNNQAFIGGQRFQSTSDARFENAFDYLIAALEVQAMHGMVQVYTKVAGAVPAFASWGFSTNQSLMPKGGGLLNGKPVDTAVGGMNPEVARANRKKFDTQGTITIGVNDNHIRALMNQVWRDFIIPYHASGGDVKLVNSFRSIQESGNITTARSTDYTRTQSDKVLSDEVLRNYYNKTQEEIDLIHARRKARIDIFAMNLTGSRKASPDMEIVRGSRFLSDLYDKLSADGEWAGVTEPKSIIESQIFPNEYWDQRVSYEHSGKITSDYLEYCNELGILHRFSGMVPSNGTLITVNGYDENGNRVKLTDLAYNEDGSINEYFWKLLTDRRMYDNEGKYLPQQRVSLSTTSAADVEEFAGTKKYGEKAGRQYDPDISAKTAERMAKEIGGNTAMADEQNLVQYQIRQEYKSEVTEWFKNTKPEERLRSSGKFFVAGTVSDTLRSVGVSEGKIRFYGSKMQTILNEHPEMSMKKLLEIPEILEDPVIVMESLTVPGSITMVSENHKAKNQEFIFVSMKLAAGGGANVEGISIVTSAYGRSNDQLRNMLIGNNDNRAASILYLSENKERAEAFLNCLRLQLPSHQNTLGSIGRVTYDGRNVNIEGKTYADLLLQFQQRRNTLSGRDVLRQAADLVKNDSRIKLTEGEKASLFIFKSRLNKLTAAQAKRLDILEQKNAILDGRNPKEVTGDEKIELRKVQNNLDTVNGMIKRFNDDVLRVEHADVLKNVLQKSRGIVEAEVKAQYDGKLSEYKAKRDEREAEIVQKYRDRIKNDREKRNETAAHKKYREQIQETAMKLSDWLKKNSDKEHVPEVLKVPLAELLESIDFSSKRFLKGGELTNEDKKFGANIAALQKLLNGQQEMLDGRDTNTPSIGAYLDLSEENREFLNDLTNRIASFDGTYTVNEMSAEELRDFSRMLKNIATAIRKANAALANARYSSIPEMAEESMKHFDSMGKARTADGKKLTEFLTWTNATPYYAFKRFGEAGKALFDGFTRGWEKLAFNAKEVIDFTAKLYKPGEAKKWRETINSIKLEDGTVIKMTTAQIMELSQLMNREQAVQHIRAGGIRIGDIKTKGIKGGVMQDVTHHHLTDADIANIVGKLTDRQRKVAEELRKYMGKRGGEWGNEISMARFGYNFYTEGENYYTIRTDDNTRPMKDTEAETNSMFRLLNLSASKSLNPNANNALVVNDIFDTFSGHMADMAKLNALGLPILDAIKWYNYSEKATNEDGTIDQNGVKNEMEKAFGKSAGKYFHTLIKDINGVKEAGDRGTGWQTKIISNYKVAAVAANLRVAFLQPTSYVRAMAILSPKSMASAFFHKNAYKEAMKYSGTAVWKSLGYYDTDIARSLRSQIVHDETLGDNIKEWSMKPAELGDQRTWGRLWVACKIEAKSRNNSLTGESLNKATADIFREVIYATQVMDSTLTRSEMMRGTTVQTKLLTAFMAEPTLSANILLDAASQYEIAKRQTNAKEAWRKNRGHIARSLITYVSTASFAALVESIVDAFRDDDDYESFLQKVMQAFFGEKGFMSGNLGQDLTVVGKIPILKNIIATLQGNTSSDMSIASVKTAVDAFNIWRETIQLADGTLENPTKVTYNGRMTMWGKIYKTLQALSQGTGFAVANSARVVTSIWNTVVAANNPDMKLKTYDAGTEKNIQYAYQDGYLTADEAYEKLMLAGIAEDEDEAWFKVNGWESGGKYNALRDAVMVGDKGAVDAEVKALTEHGVKAKDANSQIKSTIGDMYKGTDKEPASIDKPKAIDMLVSLAGMKRDDAEATATEWQCKVDTGYALGDLKDAFVSGDISRDNAVSYLIKYGKKDADAANESVTKWAFTKDTGMEYGDLREYYDSGDVSFVDAVSYLQKYGGDDAETATGKVERWEFIGGNYDFDDITVAAVGKYNELCAPAGVSKDTYFDAWNVTRAMTGEDKDGDGKSDAYSAIDKKLAYINTLPIPASQKTAIAMSVRGSNSDKTIYSRAPWL